MAADAQAGSAAGQPAGSFQEKLQTGLVTLLFTDIVGSTALKQQLGDRAGARAIEEHHHAVRELLSTSAGGREIETAGDSFLILFTTPSEAVTFALRLQAHLRQLPKTEAALSDRIGMHMGEVLIREHSEGFKPRDLYGSNVDICARVMSLAKGGQVIMSRGVFDSARQVLKGEDIEGVGQLEWLNHGPYLLKGLDGPVEICEVREVGWETLSPPTSSAKAQRQVRADEERVLGWRPAVGQVVPNTQWLLERKLGEGGFGEVWLGRHQAMKERRVFKFCFRADRVRSLKREMTLFRLIKERIGDHPNIVSLREVYFDEPPFYVEMDYVEGQDLKRWCEGQGGVDKVPLAVKLEIVAQVADALQAAHDAGVIHRDLKPANILVSSQRSEGNDPIADLRSPTSDLRSPAAKLTDFGIGQVVSQEYLAGMTKAGFTMTLLGPESSSHTGTQLYMAPELLEGKPASTRSDIYSLGVVLYQLGVGDFSRPITTDWAAEITDPLLEDDLHHCFAGKPEKRFAGAELLARNLRSLPQRRAERAKREQAERHAERRRLATRVSVAVASGLLLLAGALGYGLRRTQTEALKARRIAYASDMNVAWRALKENNLAEVRTLLQAQVPVRGQLDLRGWEWRHLWQASRGEQLFTLAATDQPVQGMAWLPNGRLVVAAEEPAGVTVWDPERREFVGSSALTSNSSGIAVSPDGQLIAVADWTVLVRLLNSASLQVVGELRHNTPVFRVAFSPDSKLLSTRGHEEVSVWDLGSGKRLWATNGTSESHSDAPFSRDGHSIFCQMRGGYLGLFGARDGALIDRRDLQWALSSKIAMSADGNQLAAADWVGRIFILDLARSATKVMTNRTGAILSVALSPDGRQLATGGDDPAITLWDIASGREITFFHGHGNAVYSLLYAPDGERLFSGSADGTVRVWKVRQKPGSAPALIPPDALASRVSRNGRFLLLYRKDTEQVSLLDLETLGEQNGTHLPLNYQLNSAAISPDGQQIAAGHRDGRVELWRNAKRSAILQAHSNAVTAVEFSQDGSLLATAAKGAELRIWGGPEHRLLWTRTLSTEPGSEDLIRDMAFTDDARLLAVAAPNIYILSLRPGGREKQIRGGGYVPTIAISRDGSLVAASIRDEVRVWDVSSLRLRCRLHGGRGTYPSISFSPDGRRILASDSLGVTWLWDLATGRDLGRFQSPGSYSFSRFQPNGDTVVIESMPIGDDGYDTAELHHAPTWNQIEDTEKAEAKSRQLWIPK